MNTLNVLLLDCSPRHINSTSRHLTARLLPAMAERLGRNLQITLRNLGTEPLKPITAEYADSLLLPAADAKERFGAALAVSDSLIEELDVADMLWISTPVHNFTVPAVLKTWIDLVVRRDVTFTTTKSGKMGLLRDRPTFVAVTSGGNMFRESPLQPDFFLSYLTTVLEVIGIKDVTFVPATGLAFSNDPLSLVEEKASEWLSRTATF
ncbi:NAD(P)H dehydrogenase [Burkholderia ubonensis]|uniref:FMN-dependent NADH-azoreductase n=1 Tax=Burkholderia ubonensis TaxID=101571 RepID=UPI0007582E2F|nr:NAD(P)H-dependent oxidoreductase [Burkholderia ubonensis]KVM07626.1 NAD(P)H dehydrogenase [Burkholderia ubonensis]KVM11404.1 NAD(P)H dehydrogenase [Burkholderia ubonensis]KVM41724.1 NAD(P)H dehydrogenase [Burkholderia ubonensis]KVO26628.1 NAD(P)H dehydrogenase [Burkholderia ubonensis]KVX50922.1 NAD(P)H dehydrogenase [Burkholderia ubonensis]